MKSSDYIKYCAGLLKESFGMEINERRMTGPAAARNGGVDEIAQMREQLANGVVEFEFWKHGENGGADVIRHAVGTTSEQIVPIAERRRLDPNYDNNVASYERRSGFIIWFWDLEKNAVRCFNTNRFERTINVQPFSRPIGNIEHVGNIFIHRDVDAGMELTPERVEEINADLAVQTDSVANEGWDDAVPGAIVIGGFDNIQLQRNQQGEPTLIIEFAKRGNDNDPPYQICVNEMRRYIRQTYNIDVKDVRVTGRFSFN